MTSTNGQTESLEPETYYKVYDRYDHKSIRPKFYSLEDARVCWKAAVYEAEENSHPMTGDIQIGEYVYIAEEGSYQLIGYL